MSSSSDEYSSLEDEAIEIEIIPELREILEADYYLINGKNKVIKQYSEWIEIINFPRVHTVLVETLTSKSHSSRSKGIARKFIVM